MLKHIKRLAFTVFAAFALVIGGAGVAQAGAHAPSAHHHRTVHHAHAVHHARSVAAEQSEEGTESTEADGPGGHEDEPGAEVDHQFEGEE